MTKAIIFPCEVFSPREVDSCFQNEYAAAVKTGGFEIVLYDYEQFVKDGTLKLSKKNGERTQAVLRSWMLNAEQYSDLYHKLLDKNLSLATSPAQYENLHLFPRVYPFIAEDTPKIICYEKEEIENISIAEIAAKFEKFIVKDFVKSEKGTDFPTYFEASITQEEFSRWLKIFRDYRGKLFTGGICIKEYVELKKSIVATNNKAEWSVCRYVGKQKKVEDDLTKGRCYYWPSAINANFFRGIVDDEEYDSYLHKIYEADWEILEDPSGMARRVLSGNADYEKEFYEAEKYKFDREFFEINSKDEADFFVKYDCASDNFFEHGKIYHVVGIINAGYNKDCYVIDFGDDGFGFQSSTITDASGFRKV